MAIQKQLETDHTINPGTRRKLNEHEDWLKNQLDLATTRDCIQAHRPNGCFCLGLGGRIEIARPDGSAGWQEYCTACDEGKAARSDAGVFWQQHEVDERAQRIRHVLRSADFGRYAGQTFESYLALVQEREGVVPPACTSVVKRLVWWTHQDKVWLYLWGPYGTGKTAACAIMASELLDRNPDLILTTVGDLCEAIQATFGVKPHNEEGLPTTEDLTHAYRETSLLIVDDLANENENITPFARQTFWRLLNDRYRAPRLTAFTSNCSPENLERILGPAVSQRILEDCLEIDMSECPSLREPK